MNRREKHLLVVTLSIVAIGLISWTLRPSTSETPTPAASTPSPPLGVPQIHRANAAAPPSPESPPAEPSGLRALRVSATDLEDFLQSRLEPAVPVTLARDPFGQPRALVAVPAPPKPVDPSTLPVVNALFYSSRADRGAVLDGEIRFLGEHHGEFELIAVDAAGVTLESSGQRVHVKFDPLAPERKRGPE